MVVGKVASKFAIKMAGRTVVCELLDPFEEFLLVYNGRLFPRSRIDESTAIL